MKILSKISKILLMIVVSIILLFIIGGLNKSGAIYYGTFQSTYPDCQSVKDLELSS